MTSYVISLASVQQAQERIRGVAHETPVLSCASLSNEASKAAGRDLHLHFKCENLQKVGAFKYRGAVNAIQHYLETTNGEPTTFVTHSSGNHAQAVALAAKSLGSNAVIVMPNNAPTPKKNAVEGYGAQVVLCEPTLEARNNTAMEWVEKTKGKFIHPSNDPDVMSGQGTAAVELLDQMQKQHGKLPDAVLIPVGGGGLCSGTAMAVKSLHPDIKVFGIEPAGAADAYASFQAKRLRDHDKPPQTIADGLRTTLGDKNFPVIRDYVDDIILVSEDEIISSMKLIWERMKLVVEPSGAVATAAALSNKLPKDIQTVGIIFSGGNIDLDKLPW